MQMVSNPDRTMPPAVRMRWHDLLFMHWRIDAKRVRSRIPAALALDEFDGSAWIGVVPFRMSGVAPRGCPTLPWLSAFPELNVRTYVTHAGRPGVWFFSLDAANPLAVRAARWRFRLPYFDARMTCRAHDGWIEYHSERTHHDAPPARLSLRYRANGETAPAEPGSLDHFLTARMCLYTVDRRRRLCRGDIDHAPWPLQPAEAQLHENTMIASLGLTVAAAPPRLLFAGRLDVVARRLLGIES